MDEPWAAAAAKDAPASATQTGGPHALWQEAEDTTAKHAPGQALENHRRVVAASVADAAGDMAW